MPVVVHFSILWFLMCGYIENFVIYDQCYNGFCYKIFNNTIKYNSLRTECTDGYGVLEIHTSQIQSDISTILGASELDFYIGYTKQGSSFEWESGASVSFQNFANGNPKGKQQCAFLSSQDSWKWKSAPCTRSLNYICYKPGDGTDAETTTSTTVTTTTEPKTTTTEPDTTTTEPETTTTEPETSTTAPETTTTEPETTTTEPETTTTEQETTTTETDTTATAPITTATIRQTTANLPNTPTSTFMISTTNIDTSKETLQTSASPITKFPSLTNTSSNHLRCALQTITCKCGSQRNVSISEELQTLYLELNNISKTAKQFQKNQKLYSRHDHRVSSQSLGYLGVGILVGLGIVLFVADISTLFVKKSKSKVGCQTT